MATEFTGSSLFGELTRNVQARIDAASVLNKRLFDSVIYRDYLDWDTPMTGLDFEELLGKQNITIAASSIGENSETPLIGTEGLETFKERVIHHAVGVPLTIQDFRRVMQLRDSRLISDDAVKNELINIMWGNTQTAVNGVEARHDMIFLGALSNKGVFTFDANNNPEGGVRGTIDYGMPAANIATADTAWTEANIETVDPFEDIQDVLAAADDVTSLEYILLSPAKMNFLCRSKKMKQMIFGSDRSSSFLSMAQINQWMEQNEMPTFRKIRRKIRVKKAGNKFDTITPWNTDNIVFIPAGKLGTVKNSLTDSELKPEPDVTYSMYGRIRISQFYIGKTKGTRHGEYTEAESLSLPVISEIKNIYTLDTNPS